LLTFIDLSIFISVKNFGCLTDLVRAHSQFAHADLLKPGCFDVMVLVIRIVFFWCPRVDTKHQLKLLAGAWATHRGISPHKGLKFHLTLLGSEKSCIYRGGQDSSPIALKSLGVIVLRRELILKQELSEFVNLCLSILMLADEAEYSAEPWEVCVDPVLGKEVLSHALSSATRSGRA
jgi:hypothetical protein